MVRVDKESNGKMLSVGLSLLGLFTLFLGFLLSATGGGEGLVIDIGLAFCILALMVRRDKET
jgi:hypothetical protein